MYVLAPGVKALALKGCALGSLLGGFPPEGQQSPLGGDHLPLTRLIETNDGYGEEGPEALLGQRHLVVIGADAELVGQVGGRVAAAAVVVAHAGILRGSQGLPQLVEPIL